MGKRRIRNLQSLGYKNIIGYDTRKDRRKEAAETYGISVIENLDGFDYSDILAVFVSVPPDKHIDYMEIARKNNLHCFIEASVVCDGLSRLADEIEKTDLKFYASTTLRFHPAVKMIKEFVNNGTLGKISNFSYHSGQYLPDWHPWEDIHDYYVGKKETGGCREIVPFELSWLNDVFGKVNEVSGINGKTIELGVDIDDVYAIALRYESNIIGTLLVDVVSRSAIRQLVINGDKGQICWNWDDGAIKIYSSENGQWTRYETEKGESADGYNKNIIEEMYIDEVQAFLESIQKNLPVRNSLRDDIFTLNCLYSAEKSQPVIV
jgi:predicted dehydrogenase